MQIYLYTGCSVTGGTSEKGVILHEKISRKYREVIECTRTRRNFKVDFLENKASDGKFLFYIFDLFFHVESLPFRLYHQLPNTLYIIPINIQTLDIRIHNFCEKRSHNNEPDFILKPEASTFQFYFAFILSQHIPRCFYTMYK